MRNLMKLAVVFLFAIATVTVSAQTPKFGHIDLQALVQLMPERATAEAAFNSFQGELEDVITEMNKELQAKYAEFEKLGTDISEVMKNAKITDIQDIQQKIQTYQQTAQQQLQQKQGELLQPVFTKAETAIAEVAKEKGLIYVFDVGQKIVLYKSNESLDLLPLVKAKLGIQ